MAKIRWPRKHQMVHCNVLLWVATIQAYTAVCSTLFMKHYDVAFLATYISYLIQTMLDIITARVYEALDNSPKKHNSIIYVRVYTKK